MLKLVQSGDSSEAIKALPIDGIIFDFDDTLFDTGTLEAEALAAMFRKAGIEMLAGDISTEAQLADIADVLNLERYELTQSLILSYEDQVSLQPGVRELLYWANAERIKLGVASNGYRVRIKNLLRRNKLEDVFDELYLIDDQPEGLAVAKPLPELYSRCARALGIDPRRTMAIEDSADGARAALAAGIGYVVVVRTELTMNQEFPDGVIFIASIVDMFPMRVFLNLLP